MSASEITNVTVSEDGRTITFAFTEGEPRTIVQPHSVRSFDCIGHCLMAVSAALLDVTARLEAAEEKLRHM